MNEWLNWLNGLARDNPVYGLVIVVVGKILYDIFKAIVFSLAKKVRNPRLLARSSISYLENDLAFYREWRTLSVDRKIAVTVEKLRGPVLNLGMSVMIGAGVFAYSVAMAFKANTDKSHVLLTLFGLFLFLASYAAWEFVSSVKLVAARIAQASTVDLDAVAALIANRRAQLKG